MCTDMCTDVCIGIYKNMCLACVQTCVLRIELSHRHKYGHACRQEHRHVYSMYVGMYVDTCMRVGMWLHMSIDVRMGMCVDMRADMPRAGRCSR